MPAVSIGLLQGWCSSDWALISDLGTNFRSWPNLEGLQWSQQIKYDLKTHLPTVLWKRESWNSNLIWVVWQPPRAFNQTTKVFQQLFWRKILVNLTELLRCEMGERDMPFKAQTSWNENFMLRSKFQHFHACSFAASNWYFGCQTLD